MFFSSGYLLLVLLPTLILSGLAQLVVRNAYSTWGKRRNSANVTGTDTARQLMQNYGLSVALSEVQQELGDHFDPTQQVVRLSPGVSRESSVAAMAIAAHEFGHVQQYADRSPLIAARTFILPVAQFGSSAAYFLIFIGLVLDFLALSMLGLVLFGAAVLFSVFTLPIEIDASRRALKMLDGAGLLRTAEDRRGARSVLTAAALTYVAALLVALLNLAYYASLVLGRRD